MGKRILVADDSLTIQKAFAMVMDGSGYALSFARSVDEAVAMAKQDTQLDLVLSDAVLGSGSGYDLCEKIKAQPALHDVPVYILASSQSPYDDARGREVGADGHLAKPFESQALLDAVASALSTPAKSASRGVFPELSADMGDNTMRVDLPFEDDDDDSYGEITIERAPAPAPAASTWNARPASRPSGSQPVISVTPAPAAQPSPRPVLIPGTRPSGSMPAIPVAKPAFAPQPVPAAAQVPTAPAPAVVRTPISRTMMGFPSVKQTPPPIKPVAPTPPPVPVVAPAPVRRFTPPTPMMAVPPHPMAAPTPPAPAALRPPVQQPIVSTPPPVPRPIVPRLSPASPTSTAPSPAPIIGVPVQPADSTTRKIRTEAPPTLVPGTAVSTASSMAAAVSSAVEQKVASLAARGPEYEAIAKLSREIIEQVVWEVVPELAEAIIRQEIDRLAGAKK